MKFELIQLPYAPDALAPAISAETLSFHHGKHLAGYVNTLNSLIEGTEFANATIEEIVCKSEGPIFNNAGQLLNHNLYFTQFAPNAGGAPKGKLLDAIVAKWGSFEAFQQELQQLAQTGQVPTQEVQDKMTSFGEKIQGNAVLSEFFNKQQQLSIYLADIERIIFDPVQDLLK